MLKNLKSKYAFLILILISMSVSVFFFIKYRSNKLLKKNIAQNQISQTKDFSYKNSSAQKDQDPEPYSIIMPSTKIIYNYYYESDGYTETIAEFAPSFLIGMTQQELKNTFSNSDWLVKDFSKEKITMQKNISGFSNQHYIIGIKDGYIAVFYQKKINGSNLKEITNTPVNSLSLEDQKRLEQGIKISGEDKLITIMQDYES